MAKLPSGIRRVEMAITKDEKYIHSIKFEGDSDLQIGSVDARDDDRWKKGRVETFEIQPAEAFLGCEIQTGIGPSGDDVFGLRWLKWRRPAVCEVVENNEAAGEPVQPTRTF